MTFPDRLLGLIADGRVILQASREAAHTGQWVAAAEMLDGWAARVEATVETARDDAEIPPDPDAHEHVAQTVASFARMHVLVTEAAAEAWRRAAEAGGVRA